MKRGRIKKDPRFSDRFPLVLGRGRIFVRPTRYGVVFILALAAMLLGAANHNNNFAFLMTFLLAGVAGLGLYRTHRNLSGLEISAVAGAPVFAGETAVFTMTVRCAFSGRRAISAAIGSQAVTPFSVAEGEAAAVDLFVQTAHRGILPAAPLRLSTVYPLGLFRAIATVTADAGIAVFPQPVAWPFLVGSESGGDDGGQSGTGEGAEDFEGLRPYRPGDPLRRVAWKAVSRGRGLSVKQFSGAAGSGAYLDWDRIPIRDVEKKLSVLCDMVLQADRAGLVFGLRLPGKTVKPAAGPAHRISCLTALARFGEVEPQW
jgi:uncharacterized protein (DUF58 family)